LGILIPLPAMGYYSSPSGYILSLCFNTPYKAILSLSTYSCMSRAFYISKALPNLFAVFYSSSIFGSILLSLLIISLFCTCTSFSSIYRSNLSYFDLLISIYRESNEFYRAGTIASCAFSIPTSLYISVIGCSPLSSSSNPCTLLIVAIDLRYYRSSCKNCSLNYMMSLMTLVSWNSYYSLSSSSSHLEEFEHNSSSLL
jgi:hypothetical protein